MTESVFTTDEIESIRSNFPHAKNGHIYLNHAAIGPLSEKVSRSIQDYIEKRHTGPIEIMEESIEITARTRNFISGYINSSSPDQVTFTGNTSEGISAVTEGLDWKPGDQVILNTMEFPSNVQPFRMLESKGVEIVYVEVKNGSLKVSDIEECITSKTRVISVSAIQYLSGFKADLVTIGKLCRDHDIFFVVDGIQALGGFQIDVRESNIDALATGGHKWLMSPMGIGFLYLSDRICQHLRPFKTGWLSVKEPWDLHNYDQQWLPVSQHLETGSPNMLGITGLGASIEYLTEIGPSRVSDRIKFLSHYLIKNLSDYPGISLYTPLNENERGGIVTFSIKGRSDYEETISRLKKQSCTISAREGYFRMAPHFYNTTDELDQALSYLL